MEKDGAWRTIGGRRVFIRNGQSLDEAMKESGKFKDNKENNIQHAVTKKENAYDKYVNRRKLARIKEDLNYYEDVVNRMEKENQDMKKELENEELSSGKRKDKQHQTNKNNGKIQEAKEQIEKLQPDLKYYEQIKKSFDVNEYGGKQDLMNSWDNDKYNESIKMASKEISQTKNLNREQMVVYSYNNTEEIDYNRPIFATPRKRGLEYKIWHIRT